MDEHKGPSKFSESSSTSLTIGGVCVKFPVKPYPSQLSMMSMIIKGLEKKQHCLLESPTGSGKSLALLCSALAWQQAQYDKANEDLMKEMAEDIQEDCSSCTCVKKQPDDMISTATTSKYFSKSKVESSENSVIDLCSDDEDFKQPLKEKLKVKETELSSLCSYCTCKKSKPDSTKGKQVEEKSSKKFRVPKIWFGTRTHKQIAQITNEMGRTGYNNARMTILSSRQHSCIHPAVKKSSNKNEDCRELRKGTHADMPGVKCAFYQNVHRMKNHHQISCAGLQSAWDLEDLVGLGKTLKTCPYYSAKELVNSANIVFCPYNYLIDPMIRKQMQINLNNQIIILDEAHNIEDCAKDAGSFTLTEDALANTTSDLEYLISDGIKVDDHRPLHLLCSRLGQWVSGHTKDLLVTDYETASQVWLGREIISHLTEWGITQDTLSLLEQNYESATDLGEEDIETARLLHSTSQTSLGGLFNVLRYLMMGDYKYCDDYRITIIKQTSYGSVPPKRTRDGWVTIHKRPKKHFVTNLHFWCLNPAVAFNDICGAHTIILTSGTLSPMSSFSSELGLAFPIQLEANHVIKDSQVWVGSIGKGPNGLQLQATYQNTDKFTFQDELGALILQVCRTIPHGVLCFFSSYNMIKKLKDRWEATGLWRSIEETKMIVCEPRSSSKDEFNSLLDSFYDSVKESGNVHNEYSTITGALLLAVCRGKVSEGLDFADNNARAVITVGIPFPSIKDKQVELKRKYNDMHKSKRGLLSGSQWYEIQAYRAMNQALGRCIRHKDDWGALIIVDDRFCKNPGKYCQGLSKWVRQKMQTHSSYNSAMESITAFVQAQTGQNGSMSIMEKMIVKKKDGKNPENCSLDHKQTAHQPEKEAYPSPSQKQSSMYKYFNQSSSGEKRNNDTRLRNLKPAVADANQRQETQLSPDEDFKGINRNGQKTRRSSFQKVINRTEKIDESAVKLVTSKDDENQSMVSDETNTSFTDRDIDDLHEITIPATPEKSLDVTIVPESPCSVNGDEMDAVRLQKKEAHRSLDFKPYFPGTPKRKRNPVNQHLETPSSKRIGTKKMISQRKRKKNKTTITGDIMQSRLRSNCDNRNDEFETNSEEFPPRRRRNQISKMKSEIHCIDCGRTFYRKNTKIEKQCIQSTYLCHKFSSNNNGKLVQNSMFPVYAINCEDVLSDSISSVTSNVLTGTSAIFLNSVWWEKDQKCYQMYKCSKCSTLVATRIISDPTYKRNYMFMVDKVT